MQDKESRVELMKQCGLWGLEHKKLYLKGLQCAVAAGAVSVASLQKKVKVDRQMACGILDWMIEQGFVKDEGGTESLKTTLLRETEFDQLIQELGMSLKSKREKQRTIDDVVYKACLRLAIRRGRIRAQVFVDELAIGRIRAEAIVDKMQEEKLLEYKGLAGWQMLMSKEQFKEL